MCSALPRLAYLRVNCGHLTYPAPGELADVKIDFARDLLERALADRSTSWGDYCLYASRFGGGLHMSIGKFDGESEIVTLTSFGVATRARSGRALWDLLLDLPDAASAPVGLSVPPSPWVAAVRKADLLPCQDIMPILGELETALAWAWLERQA